MRLEPGDYEIPAGMVAAVVTHLEMTARVEQPNAPLPDGATLHRVKAPGAGWYRDLFTRIGADWLWLSRLRMPETDLAAILSNPDVEVSALEIDGRAEGLLELDFRQPGACELAFLGLTPIAQHRGIGRALMRVAVETAFARPLDRLHVHTCTLDSPTALPFYLRRGFRAVRREVEIFYDPRLSGHLPPDAAPLLPVIDPDRSAT